MIFSLFVLVPFMVVAKSLLFVTTANFPPFEYYSSGEIVGFDAELAYAIAKKMGYTASIKDLDIPLIFVSVKYNRADATIGCWESTPDREKHFDFSIPYMATSYSIICRKEAIFAEHDLSGKKVGLQFGTDLEGWLQECGRSVQVEWFGDIRLAIESLKVGYVDALILDSVQALQYCQKNPQLTLQEIAGVKRAYRIVLAKGSPLKHEMDCAIKELKSEGFLEELKKRHLEAS